MDATDREKMQDEILKQADRMLYYNELLLEQCEGWLSAEEGNRNMLQQISERLRKEKELEKEPEKEPEKE
jgi:hypothetical protein